MIYLHAIVSLALLLGGCKNPTDSTSEEKFAQRRSFSDDRLLIKYIDAEKWQIVYGFYGKPETCSSPVLLKSRDSLSDEEKKKRDEITLQIENNIADALDTWLSPLRKLKLQKRIITKEDFEFKELTPIPIGEMFGYTAEHLEKNNLLSTTDLTIAFGCGDKDYFNGFAWVGDQEPPNIYIHEASIPHKNRQHKNRQHLVLLHEIGHAFGLADTYKVFGQSMAVMNTAAKKNYLADTHTPSLESDDIKGIEWLYYYYNDPGKISGDPCFFDDYEMVKRSRDKDQAEFYCQPKYPVIHEVKQAYFREQHLDLEGAKGFMANAVSYWMSDKITIGKKDDVGRTALHYAVIHESQSECLKTDWRQTIKGLLKNGFNKEIKDNEKKTACNYLQCEDNETDMGKECSEIKGNEIKGNEIECSEINSLLCP